MINLSDKLTAKTVENILGESKEIGYIFGDANPRTTNTVAGALNEVKTELLSMVHAGDIVGNPTADWKQGTVEEYVDNKILEQNIKVDEVLKAQQRRLNTLNGNEVIVVNSLPSSGSVGIIYRVPNDPDEGHYSDYMWDINIATPAWKKLASYTYPGLDEVPTSGSANFVKSGGVFDEITNNGAAFDVTVYNSGVTYASLSEALNAVPADYKKGGMSIKYVQSSDNKYVQYFLTKNTWSKSDGDWEKVNLEEEVSQLGQKMFKIKHIGTTVTLWHDWEAGDYMYYSENKFFIEVLGVDGSGNITSFKEFLPTLGAIYTYDNQLYIWNGTDLVQKTKDVSISQIVQNGDIDGIVKIGVDSFEIRNATFDESYGLKNSYIWSDGWNNDPKRVSTKILNAKLASIRIVCKDNIKIAGYTTLNDDYSFSTYNSLSSQTIQDLTLDAGYYYQVIFMFENGGNITPQDVLPHIAIGESISIQTLESQMDKLYGIDLSEDFVTDRWFTGTTVGQGLTEVFATGTISVKTHVSQGDIFRLTAKGGNSGRAWYFLDADENIIALSASDFNDSIKLTIPSGVSYLVAQSNNVTMTLIKGGVEPQIEMLDEKVDGLEVDSFKPKTPFLWSKLSRVKNLKDIFANIGFIGDSWTQGTENIVGGVTSGFESYDKWVAKALWDEYGFGGLGWLDFARDGAKPDGTSAGGKMFGCIDMYEHWSYVFSGTANRGYDGNQSGHAANCLGICCAHTIFDNGTILTLTFDANYLDVFKIRYYKNAHFSISINGGAAVEITANETDDWQETSFGTIGTDITSVIITSLADNSIIFGMDCYYGTYGVRCHKIGNRSISASSYLAMNATQWERGIAKLELCWASVLLAINDLGESTDPTRMDNIVVNIGNLINRLKAATDDGNGLVTCDINLLGVENIEATGWMGLGMLAVKQKEFALANGYGWTSTDKCIGTTKAEFVHNRTFSDTIHLNIIGSYAYGQHIYNSLFKF